MHICIEAQHMIAECHGRIVVRSSAPLSSVLAILSIRFSSGCGSLSEADQPERERAAIYNHVLLCDPCQTKRITFTSSSVIPLIRGGGGHLNISSD